MTLDKLETNRYPKVVANRMLQISLLRRLVIAYGLFAMAASAQQLTLEIKDYATLPITGLPRRSQIMSPACLRGSIFCAKNRAASDFL